MVAGHGFEEAGYFLKFTMFYGLFIPFNRQFSITLDALGKAKFNFVIVLLTLLLCTLLSYFFGRQFELIGAIYGNLATYVAVFIFAQIYLYKHFHISLLNIAIGVLEGYKLVFVKVKKLLE